MIRRIGMRKKIVSVSIVAALGLALTANLTQASVLESKDLSLNHISSYSTGTTNVDGGVAEIVKFNSDNSKMYLVNGQTKTVDIVKVNTDGTTSFNAETDRIDVSTMVPGFIFGDITSVEINTKQKIIIIAAQEADYSKAGAVVILDYEGNIIKSVQTGVQPDMVTCTPDGNYILIANEGEPRNGYEGGVVDPKGSVTLIDLKNGVNNALGDTITFDGFDSKRSDLIANKVILKKGALPSKDLEPEYIAVASNSQKAYVSLQEANSIATFDIESKTFTSIKGLGFKDHNLDKNSLDSVKDGTINIKPQNLYGVYMPDGITTFDKNGKTYILTANEGDSREWGTYKNTASIKIDGQKVDILNVAEHDGLESGKSYIFGGRSFSIWDAETMSQVFDSGSDFESITAEKFKDNFNASNNNTTIDSRSGKKGPEPEDVKVGIVDGQVFAFIGLERIGGIMAYNITNPENATFTNYVNTRDFRNDIAGDVSPEGLCFVPSDKSPIGKSMLLTANEVSGTIALFAINSSVKIDTIKPELIVSSEVSNEANIINLNATGNITSNPKTGDNSSMPVIGIMMFLSAAGIAIVIKKETQ
jgi:hypothetical protein